MIQRLGRSPAILATVTVPAEHGPTGDWRRPAVWDFDESVETHNGRDFDDFILRGPDLVLAYHHAGFLVQDEDDRPPGGHHRERLVAGVQDKDPCHE
jgi:hypothetical protein